MDDNVKKDVVPPPTPQPTETKAVPQQSEPASPPLRVVRTFASDMAALHGAPAPAPKPIPKEKLHTPDAVKPVAKEPAPQAPAPAAPLPQQPKKQSEAPRINLPPKPVLPAQPLGFLDSLLEQLFSLFTKKEKVTEVAKLSSSSWQKQAPKPAPPPPPPPKPKEPEPVVTETYRSPTVQESPADREAVLARLRAKVASQPQMPPPPVFPAPKPEAPRAPEPAWTPPGFTPPPAQSDDERLRTYSGDFSTRVDDKKASAFSVLAAQSDAARSDAPILVQKSGGHGLAYVLAGTVLIVGGSLGIYFAYQYMGANAPVPLVDNNPDALISSDDWFTLAGTGSALIDALAAEAGQPMTTGNVRIAYLETSSTTPAGVITQTEPGGALIRAMNLSAPDILLRNIGSESTVGILRAGNETRAFFVLGARSYERTFAGMLAWEANIQRDLAALYPAYPAAEVATTTATTTAPRPSFRPGFSDAVVESHDVRVLKDEEGRTLLIYGYRDPETLIIARDETAFSLLLARLSATSAD